MPQNVPCPHRFCGCVDCTAKRLKDNDKEIEILALKDLYDIPAPIPHKHQ